MQINANQNNLKIRNISRTSWKFFKFQDILRTFTRRRVDTEVPSFKQNKAKEKVSSNVRK